jgi:hypothetical protein
MRIDPPRIYLGDTATLTIEVDISDARGSVTFPAIAGVPEAEITFARKSQNSYTSQRREGGRLITEVVSIARQDYAIRPLRAGEFNVPPQTVTIGGATARTPPARLLAVEPAASTDTTLTLELQRGRVYVGESVPFTLTWTVPNTAGIGDFDFGPSVLPDGVEAALPGAPNRGRSRQFLRKRLFGRDTEARLTNDPAKPNAAAVQFQGEFSPLAPGQILFDGLGMTYERTPAGSSAQRFFARAEPITLEVVGVPEAGRPNGYTGLIGVYDIVANATPTSVNVGDPITLTVTILGREPMRGVSDGPDLQTAGGLTPAFKLSSEGWTPQPNTSMGRRTFTTTIRAARDTVESIPPIDLHFFDPASETFRVARTDAIPLEVRATRLVTAADAIMSGEPHAATNTERSPLRLNTKPDIWAITTGDPVLTAAPIRSPFTLGVAGIATAAAAPVAAYLAVLFSVALRARRDPAATRRARALRRARAKIRNGRTAEAVRGFVADAFDRPEDAITSTDCQRLLAQAGVPGASDIAHLVAASESTRFGDRPATPDDTHAAARLLRTAHNTLRRSAR